MAGESLQPRRVTVDKRGQGGGALAAAATEREDVRLELSQADSDLLSETINDTLIKWICEYNGLEPCLVYRKIEKEEDTRAESETDKNISELGFQMTEEGAKAKYGEHWERKAAAPSISPRPDMGNPISGAADFAEGDPAAPDAIDRLVSAELGQWRSVVDPIAAPLRKLLEKAAADGLSAAELMERLPELLASMDDSALVESLTALAYAARLAGNAGGEKV